MDKERIKEKLVPILLEGIMFELEQYLKSNRKWEVVVENATPTQWDCSWPWPKGEQND